MVMKTSSDATSALTITLEMDFSKLNHGDVIVITKDQLIALGADRVNEMAKAIMANIDRYGLECVHTLDQATGENRFRFEAVQP
jgi:hypothetical protein